MVIGRDQLLECESALHEGMLVPVLVYSSEKRRGVGIGMCR